METPEINKRPFYIRASIVIVGLYFLVSMLYMAQAIILPLIYALIVAILLSPAVGFLVRKKVNRAVAIAGVLFLALLVLALAVALIASQARLLGHAWPGLIDKLSNLLTRAVTWSSGALPVSTQKINAWLSNLQKELISNSDSFLGSSLMSAGGILSAALLTPVYIFMILLYQPHLLAFIRQLFGADNVLKVSEILTGTKAIVKSYIVGLFGKFVIIAILNSIGLLALRIDYAIILGIIGAALNVIPIIGGIVCVVLFAVVALLTKSPVYILYVLGVYAVIQFIDDHYIFPKIVGAKVKLNLLVSIIAVILGDALWGIPGMFLAIPLIAILKLILDRIDSLRPWGFLLGDTVGISIPKMKFTFLVKGFKRQKT